MAAPDFLLKADLDVPDVALRALREAVVTESPPDEAPLNAAIATALRATVRQAATEWHRGTFHWIARGLLQDGREIATRVVRLDHPALHDGLLVAATASAAANRAHVAASHVLATAPAGPGLEAPFSIATWVRGRTLAHHDEDEVLVTGVLQQLGALLARLHTVTAAGAGLLLPATGALHGRCASWGEFLCCRLDEHLSACEGLGVLSSTERGRVRAILLEDGWWGDEASRLLHGDPGPANIIVGSDRVLAGLLDWEDALAGDPLFDVASAAGFHPPRRWPALFRGYWDAERIPSGAAERYWRYFLRLSLARTVARARFGIEDLPGRAPAAGRIQRALDGIAQPGAAA